MVALFLCKTCFAIRIIDLVYDTTVTKIRFTDSFEFQKAREDSKLWVEDCFLYLLSCRCRSRCVNVMYFKSEVFSSFFRSVSLFKLPIPYFAKVKHCSKVGNLLLSVFVGLNSLKFRYRNWLLKLLYIRVWSLGTRDWSLVTREWSLVTRDLLLNDARDLRLSSSRLIVLALLCLKLLKLLKICVLH